MVLTRRLVGLLLFLLVLLAYEGVRGCGFVGFDDPLYVSANPEVLKGLTMSGVRWAFSAGLLFDTPHADYWAPLTVLCRMLDATLYGADPAGHHLTNVLLHALDASLLFLVLERLTGALRRSALAAALFAVHPLCVESVAWVTETKTVLSGLFWLLGIGAYVGYVRRPTRGRYALVFAALVLGLMAKPIVMTLPLVLLLLDYWPLGRVPSGWGGLRRSAPALVREKLPLLLVAVVAPAVLYLTLGRSGHLRDLGSVPAATRAASAVRNYLVYLGKAIWPHPLAIAYPDPAGGPPIEQVLLAAGALAGLSAFAFVQRRRRPWVLVGWLWFLVALFPAIGLVQSGAAVRADRHMYLPLAGLALVAAWGAGELVSSWPRVKRPVCVTAAGVLVMLTVLTHRQVRTWTDTATLFEHALQYSSDNALAHNNLATALAQAGRFDAAEAHYREALHLEPGYADASRGLSAVLVRRGRTEEAAALFASILDRAPANVEAHLELAGLCARRGRAEEAAGHYAAALAADPASATAHYRWGNLLARSGQWAAAEAHYAQAVRLRPDDAEALANLGLTRALQGRWEQAIETYRLALRADPTSVRARTSLGQALAAQGRHDEAISQYWAALAARSNDVDAHFQLARSMAARGWLGAAVVQMERVTTLDPAYPGADAELVALRRASAATATAAGSR